MHTSKHSTLHGADSQDHGRLSVVHTSKQWNKKKHAQTCRTPWSVLEKSRELWARPTVLPWSVSRDTPEKLAFHVRLLGPCFETATMEESKKRNSFFVWRCLGERDVQVLIFHIVWNSLVRKRTVTASGALSDTEDGVMFDYSRLRLWAATLHGDRIAQTATMDVIDPPRGLRLSQTAQAIGESLQFSLKS